MRDNKTWNVFVGSLPPPTHSFRTPAGGGERGRSPLFYWRNCNNNDRKGQGGVESAGVLETKLLGDWRALVSLEVFHHSDWLQRTRLWVGALRSSFSFSIAAPGLSTPCHHLGYLIRSFLRTLPLPLLCISPCACPCNSDLMFSRAMTFSYATIERICHYSRALPSLASKA